MKGKRKGSTNHNNQELKRAKTDATQTTINELIERAKADSTKKTALMYAVETPDNVEIIKLLLKNSSWSIFEKDNKRKNALMYAVTVPNNVQNINYLLETLHLIQHSYLLTRFTQSDDENPIEYIRNALFLAVLTPGNATNINALLKEKGAISLQDKKGQNALMYAVSTRNNVENIDALLGYPNSTKKHSSKTKISFNLKSVTSTISSNQKKTLLHNHVNTSIEQRDNEGRTVLMHAVRTRNNQENINRLLKQYDILMLKDYHGIDALMYAVQITNNVQNINALFEGYTNLVQTTYEFNIKRQQIKDKPKQSDEPLRHHKTIIQKNFTVDEWLDAKDTQNHTALIHAVKVPNNVENIKYLVGKCIDYIDFLNQSDPEGRTVLMHASLVTNNIDNIKYLLDNLVDDNVHDRHKNTLLMLAVKTPDNIENVKFLDTYKENKYFQDEDETIPLFYDLDIDAQNNEGKTALMNAVVVPQNEKVITYLIEKMNADINKKDKKGKTALTYALSVPNNENVVYMLSRKSGKKSAYARG